MNLVEYIESHPSVAFVVGVVHIVSATVAAQLEIPIIVMQLFQLGAWSVTICVGTISIYGFLKRNFLNIKETRQKKKAQRK